MTGQAITIQTSDMGNIEVKLTQNSTVMKDSLFIEVVGKVDDHGESLREFTCADMGNDLSASLLHRLLKASLYSFLASLLQT